MSHRRTIAAILCFLLVLTGLAIVPGSAWAPGSVALRDGWPVEAHTVLRRDAELAVDLTSDGHAVLVSTGDGGGAGRIDGLDDGPIRVAETTFRGVHAWEIGTLPEHPATYVNDDGVRLDDGIMDRLRGRALVLAIALAFSIAVARVRR